MMTSSLIAPVLSVADKVYRALLLVYPAEHRREYGPLMVQLFDDLCQDAIQEKGMCGLALFWSHTLVDVAWTAAAEHLDRKGRVAMANIPTKIDRYEVRAQVGSSPSADIYRAADPKSGRDVVVKVMKENPDEGHGVLLRFHRHEAELLRRLEHPALPSLTMAH